MTTFSGASTRVCHHDNHNT